MRLLEAKQALRAYLERGVLLELMERAGVHVEADWKRRNRVEIKAMIVRIESVKRMGL